MLTTTQMRLGVEAMTRSFLATLVAVRTIARVAREARHTGLKTVGQAAALVSRVARLGARTAAVLTLWYLICIGHESYCNTFPTGSRVTCAVRRLELGARDREQLVVTTGTSPEPFVCAWTGSQDFAQLGCIPLDSPSDRNATRSFAIASYSVSAQALSVHGASAGEWSPFVVDGHVSTWIVPCGRTMLSRQAVALTSVVPAPRNPVTFSDIRHWERLFGFLIHRLSEAERETRATPYERGAKISWSASLDGSPLWPALRRTRWRRSWEQLP